MTDAATVHSAAQLEYERVAFNQALLDELAYVTATVDREPRPIVWRGVVSPDATPEQVARYYEAQQTHDTSTAKGVEEWLQRHRRP